MEKKVSLNSDEKKFYDRFFNLHRDPQLVKVLEKFGIGVFRRSSVLEGFEQFLEENDVRGQRCVEIGTCMGLTALVLARRFSEVVTIDIEPNGMKSAIAEYLGVTNIKFIDVPNNEAKAEVILRIGRFDAAYSDGDHCRDTQFDFDLVRSCGRVIFHEYWEDQEPVVKLVDRLRVVGGGRVTTKGKFALWTV